MKRAFSVFAQCLLWLALVGVAEALAGDLKGTAKDKAGGALADARVIVNALVGIRFGVRLGPHSIVIDADNLGDESYRGTSWGMDGAGRGISVRYSVSFR